MSIYTAPGVYINESDQTEQKAGIATSVACVVITSSKGPVDRRVLCKTPQEYITTFGSPDPAMGEGYFAQISALAFLAEGRNLLVTRVHNGAIYGGVRFIEDQDAQGNNALSGKLVPLSTFNLEDPYADDTVYTETDAFTIYDYSPGVNDIRIKLTPNTTTQDGGFYVNVFSPSDASSPIEKYLVSLTYKLNGMGEQMFIEDHINLRSKTVVVRVNNGPEGFNYQDQDTPLDDNLVFNAAPESLVANFASGSVGGPVSPAQVITGYGLYEVKESSNTNIIINGGWSDLGVKREIARIADARRAMAILDIPISRQRRDLAVDWRKNTLNLDNNHAALYTPWLKVTDINNNTNIWAPPSGFVAATYARTDADFAAWFSPAGMNRGDLNGGIGSSGTVLGVKEIYSLADQEEFKDAQINPILSIPGYGIKIWGDYTLQTRNSMLSYIPVRRMLDYVENSMEISLRFSNFDPNDDILRSQLVTDVEAFLDPIKTGRGLEAYSVVSDESNNPKDRIAAGELRVSAAMTPVSTARVIILDAILTKSGADFSESVQAAL